MSSASKSMSVEREKESKQSPSPPKEEKPKRQDPDSHKIFLSNLNGQFSEKQVEDQIKRLFQKYGQVKKLSLKKHKNGFYYFGFLEYPPGFEAYEAIKALDQHPLFGKNMKVQDLIQNLGDRIDKAKAAFTAKKWGTSPDNAPKTEIEEDRAVMVDEAETETTVEETIGMTEETGMIECNSGVIVTDPTESVKEVEMSASIVMTGIVIMKGTVIEMKSADVAKDLTQVQDLLQKAVTEDTIVKTRRTREDVQEAD